MQVERLLCASYKTGEAVRRRDDGMRRNLTFQRLPRADRQSQSLLDNGHSIALLKQQLPPDEGIGDTLMIFHFSPPPSPLRSSTDCTRTNDCAAE